MAQLVKNPPAMRETWVRSLAWEDPLERGTATHSSVLPWAEAASVSSQIADSLVGQSESEKREVVQSCPTL